MTASDDAAAVLRPCSACGHHTSAGTLREFGARCFPCWQAWLRENPPTGPRQPSVNCSDDDTGRAWALALEARELAGETLSPFQRDAWRAALANRRSSTP